ncbi:hypothetical protein TEA_026828 [Camellia sinensis var. sinensis]|uniref:Methyltransferase type 11 domain-containing protein n=2 Tax=Camellia sinensis TaxID=4442 RepID=A0A4S4E994_CAMSN|nr:hypothetical protein TEA_026828 [Camellia sinensis var. sinensis]
MMVRTLFNSSSTVLLLKTKVDLISNQNLLGKATTTRRSLKCNGRQVHGSDSSPTLKQSNDKVLQSRAPDSLCAHRFCSCGRRRLMEAIGTSFFAIPSSSASPPPLDDPEDVLNSIHPPRPDWYEELYAFILDKGSKAYEAEVAGFKSQIFTNLRGKAKTVLELGIGTGPNLKYYASDNGVHVFGIDPNRKMEKYAQAAAATAGLPPENFKFVHAVETQISDGSINAYGRLRGDADPRKEETGPVGAYEAVHRRVDGVRPLKKHQQGSILAGIFSKGKNLALGRDPNFRWVNQCIWSIAWRCRPKKRRNRTSRGLRSCPQKGRWCVTLKEASTRVDTDREGVGSAEQQREIVVDEALPLSDASVDVVVGTLVLCSVKDINMTLKEVMRVLKPGGLFLFVEHVAAKDGTILRFVQGILDPLQQRVSDGCHLTRKTGEYISEAGFSDVDVNMAFVSVASILGPHVYGIACK